MKNKVILITNTNDITIDYVVKELKNRNIMYYRLNTDNIPNNINIDFDFENENFKILDLYKKIELNLHDFNSVYYRRPVINSLDYLEEVSYNEKIYLQRELFAIFEGIYKILEDKFWLNNVYRIREAENKIYQLILAKNIGFNTPETVISNNFSTIEKIVEKYQYNNIIKSIKNGYIDDNKVIFTSLIDGNVIKNQISMFPNFIQNNIEKFCDIRCTIIGNDIFSAEILSQNEISGKIDWRRSKHILEHKKHKLPIDIELKCIELTKKLKLNYSAIDLVLDKNGKYIFLEINPNGQWAWIENILKFPISKRIVDILTNCQNTF